MVLGAAGNASLEEVVMALYTRRNSLGFTTGIKTREIYRTSRLVSTLTGMAVQPNKAIVGKMLLLMNLVFIKMVF